MTKNRLPPEDLEEWQNFSASIKPIKHRLEPPELPTQKLPRFFASSNRTPSFAMPSAPLQPGEKSGVDRNSFNALSKGKMPIDAKLDLHGKNFAQAFRIFKNFIIATATDGKRCVLIITGKGKPEAEATLHNSFPNWINHEDIRPYIITYTDAAPHQGGTGAYTVLLKRQRN